MRLVHTRESGRRSPPRAPAFKRPGRAGRGDTTPARSRAPGTVSPSGGLGRTGHRGRRAGPGAPCALPCRGRRAGTFAVYGRCIGGPAARIISCFVRCWIPAPVPAEITDRVQRQCGSRTAAFCSAGTFVRHGDGRLPHWSRPSGFRVCSVFARMSRYRAVAPVSGRHSVSGDYGYLASMLA
jgi:hypothetical protein